MGARASLTRHRRPARVRATACPTRAGLSRLAWSLTVASASAPSAAQAPAETRSALVVGCVTLGPDLSPRLSDKIADLLRAELSAARIAVVPGRDVENLRQGATTAPPPDLREARAALESGKDLYLRLEVDRAAERLEAARQAFESALPQTGDFAPLAEALGYLGASRLEMKDLVAADAAFRALLSLRPGFDLDARVYSPDVVQAFARAKFAAAQAPVASLAISSVPQLASVVLDGERRGETPVAIEGVPVGRHYLRIEAPEHHPWSGVVEVSAPATTKEIRLDPSRAAEDLRAIEAEARGEGRRAWMVGHAVSLAQAVQVDGVAVAALSRASGRYLLAVALVQPPGSTRVAWTAIDADLLRARPAVRTVTQALLASPGPSFADAGVSAPGEAPDFAARLLGLSSPKPDGAAAPPWYTRWWVWAAVAAVAAGSVTAYVATRPGTVSVDVEF